MAAATSIMMVRPAAFGYNIETAANNHFQHQPQASAEELQALALTEFDNMVDLLRKNEIDVIVIEDTPEPRKPDAIFPNNWISTSPEGTLVVFPMFAATRRAEKRADVVNLLNNMFEVLNFQDWSEYEAEGRFLEGTGSMIIDHDNRLIYASASERTSIPLLEKFAAANNFQAMVFLATDSEGRPVYHTNVLMALGEGFVVLCEEAIEEEWELIALRQLLDSTGHVVIPISRDQMNCFAGNVLQVQNRKGEKFIIISKTAFDCLNKEQIQMLEAYGNMLVAAVPTIEKIEGGSVRCMMAEIFLKKRDQGRT